MIDGEAFGRILATEIIPVLIGIFVGYKVGKFIKKKWNERKINSCRENGHT